MPTSDKASVKESCFPLCGVEIEISPQDIYREEQNMSETDGNKSVEAAAYAAGGAVAGGVVSCLVGGMGLAGGFGAISIGAAPVIAAGAVTGLAVKTVLDSWKAPSPKKRVISNRRRDRFIEED